MPAPLQTVLSDYFMRAPTDATLNTTDPNIQALMNSGAISASNADWSNFWQMGHPGETNPYFVDPTKLPSTPYGDITSIRAVDSSGQVPGGFKMINPSMVYNDPNYGMITSGKNTIDPSSQRNWYDMIGPLAMSAVLMGAGSLPAFGGATLATAGETATSLPWYSKLGMSLAKMATSGIKPISTDLGIPAAMQQGATGTQATTQSATQAQPLPPLVTGGYDATLYGDMNAVAPATSDGSQYVSTAVAPDAYNNSYNQVIG